MQQLTPQQIEILNALAAGTSVSAAAADAGLHRTTIHHWCRQFPKFRLALDTLKRARTEAVQDQISDLSNLAISNVKKILEDASAPANLRLKAALSVLRTSATPEPEFRPVPTPKMTGADADIWFDAVFYAAEKEAAASHERCDARDANPVSPDEPEPATPKQTPSGYIPRSAQCPCGSGQKYKRCCGINAPPHLTTHAA